MAGPVKRLWQTKHLDNALRIVAALASCAAVVGLFLCRDSLLQGAFVVVVLLLGAYLGLTVRLS